MARVTVDTSEVAAAVAEMRDVSARMRPDIAASVKRGANNIKNDLVEQMRSSLHFKGFAPGISYDMVDDFQADIGPERKPSPGAGANLAYFGTWKGGGTVEDPEAALEREVPKFEEHMLDIAERSVFG